MKSPKEVKTERQKSGISLSCFTDPNQLKNHLKDNVFFPCQKCSQILVGKPEEEAEKIGHGEKKGKLSKENIKSKNRQKSKEQTSSLHNNSECRRESSTDKISSDGDETEKDPFEIEEKSRKKDIKSKIV